MKATTVSETGCPWAAHCCPAWRMMCLMIPSDGSHDILGQRHPGGPRKKNESRLEERHRPFAPYTPPLPADPNPPASSSRSWGHIPFPSSPAPTPPHLTSPHPARPSGGNLRARAGGGRGPACCHGDRTARGRRACNGQRVRVGSYNTRRCACPSVGRHLRVRATRGCGGSLWEHNEWGFLVRRLRSCFRNLAPRI